MATYETLSGIIRGPPNSKAPGADEAMAEIVRVEEGVLCSAILPLYRAIFRSGCILEN